MRGELDSTVLSSASFAFKSLFLVRGVPLEKPHGEKGLESGSGILETRPPKSSPSGLVKNASISIAAAASRAVWKALLCPLKQRKRALGVCV